MLPKYVPKIVAEIFGNRGGSSTPEISGDAISANFIRYSQSYEFLKFAQNGEKVTLFPLLETRMN